MPPTETISILCLLATPNAMLRKNEKKSPPHDAPTNSPNSGMRDPCKHILPHYLHTAIIVQILSKTNVSCILTTRLVHPSRPSFAEARTVVVVSAGHAFALTTLDPLVVDVLVYALKVQSK